MEKKLLKLIQLLQKKFNVCYIRYTLWDYGTSKEIVPEFSAYNGSTFIESKTIENLTDKLVANDWINAEDLIPKTRTKKEITTTNKGKFQ